MFQINIKFQALSFPKKIFQEPPALDVCFGVLFIFIGLNRKSPKLWTERAKQKPSLSHEIFLVRVNIYGKTNVFFAYKIII